MANRSDNFNRADNASSIGSPSDGGGAWSTANGTFGISGNELYRAGGSGYAFAWLDAAVSAGTVSATFTAAGSGGLAARIVDANNLFYLEAASGSVGLYKRTGGSFGAQVGSTYNGGYNVGDTFSLAVDGSGNWTVTRNGTTIITGTDNAHSTGTGWGIGYTTSGAKWDGFAFVDPAAGTAPSVTTHPSSQTVTAGSTATFTAAFSGSPTPTLQWQRSTNSGGSWSDISGATSASYTTPATTVSGGSANNGDQYRCGGTNAAGGPVYTNAATLTVNAAPSGPTIDTQPSNQTVTAPATATFTVAATTSGGALSYQWQRQPAGGGGYANVSGGSGATTASYTTGTTSVSGGSHNNGDTYRVNVTDSNGTATSSAATLTVNAALAGLTSSPLKDNTGTLHLNAPFEAFVLNATTGALVVRKTGLTSNASTGVVTFNDATLTAATQYRVVWRRTDTGAQGVELLTAA